MAYRELKPADNPFNSSLPLAANETANRILGTNGDDVIRGNHHKDFLHGLGGNDKLVGDKGPSYGQSIGSGSNDVLSGGAGNDLLIGDNEFSKNERENLTGRDVLNGEAGDDTLWGGNGNDLLRGGTGNDVYLVRAKDTGQDTINDDLSAAGNTGYGGGNDRLQFIDVPGADLMLGRKEGSNDLYVTTKSDASFSSGVKIENFYLGGNNLVETIVGNDGVGWVFSSSAV